MGTPANITAHYLIGEISPDHLIFDHTFMYVIKGTVYLYDGSVTETFRSGNYGLARKNRLARFKKEKEGDELEKVFVFFDEEFLKAFQEKHKILHTRFTRQNTFIKLETTDLLPNFINSLLPYYKGGGIIEDRFKEIKREELLLILLQSQPDLAGIFFDYGSPEKLNLEEFMNRNYKFNVSVDRFAYLTGRSISAFKRDFKEIFNETPSRWLVQRRLQEAYFLIGQKGNRPSDIYLDLGFETLSHFSFAFKKQFSMTPTDLISKNAAPLSRQDKC